jgi:multicomponent Na+:H+ antiporter subunit E
MKHLVSSFCVLTLLWLGNSGHYSIMLLTLGFFSVVMVVWISHHMRLIDNESQPLQLMGKRLPGYYAWLARKIVSGNLDVVYRIWRGNQSLSPVIGKLRMSQESDMGRVVFANSITLTPGTVAMDMDSQEVFVHSITRQGLEELRQGEMDRRVCELEASS